MIRLGYVDWIALAMVIIGALNWLLTAFGFNLIDNLFGVPPSAISMFLYLVIGLSGLWLIYLAYRLTRPRVGLDVVDWIALALVIVSSLLWLAYAFGLGIGGDVAPASPVSTILYILIGLSGLWLIYLTTRIIGAKGEV